MLSRGGSSAGFTRVLVAVVLVAIFAPTRMLGQEDEIRPADVLTVIVAGEPDLTSEYTVDANGRIVMPLVGAVAVDGLQPWEAEYRIKAALADGYLTFPRVTVIIARSASRAGVVVGPAIEDVDVIVAAGTLGGQVLSGSLFHVGEFWMRSPANTAFNRWLSQGLSRHIVIRLMTDPARFADVKDVRILTGTLIHQIAPQPTPANIDAIGRLPYGDQSFVHMLFLRDELTGAFGPVTFETSDFGTASKFDAYDGTEISIVIAIQ